MTRDEFWELRALDWVSCSVRDQNGIVESEVVRRGVKAVWVAFDDGTTAVYGEDNCGGLRRLGSSPDSQKDGSDRRPILIWSWNDAPLEYRALIFDSGDEDWVAFIPDSFRGDPSFLDEGTPFGCFKVSERSVEGGTVRIGAHA